MQNIDIHFMKRQIILYMLIFLSSTIYAFVGDVEVDGLWYYINTNEKTAAVVSHNGTVYKGDIVLPEHFDYVLDLRM